MINKTTASLFFLAPVVCLAGAAAAGETTVEASSHSGSPAVGSVICDTLLEAKKAIDDAWFGFSMDDVLEVLSVIHGLEPDANFGADSCLSFGIELTPFDNGGTVVYSFDVSGFILAFSVDNESQRISGSFLTGKGA